MRVIAGTLRGRRLQAPPDRTTRPTPDRVREALFSALESALGGPGALHGARVLDLFAGTGALGIEALSRGAVEAVFVEPDARALAALRANLAALGLDGRARVVPGTAQRFLESREERRYQVVFLDPPFTRVDVEACLLRLAEARLVAGGGLAVVEHPAGEAPLGSGWDATFQRDYGSVGISFLTPPWTREQEAS